MRSCWILLLLFLLAAFPGQVAGSSQGTVEITAIVDKATGRPIPENTVTLRWESAEGEVLNSKTHRNQSSLTMKMQMDGSVRLWITVAAAGYETWGNAIRMNLNQGRPLYIEVEMEKISVGEEV